MPYIKHLILISIVLFSISASAEENWVEKSNDHAKPLLDLQAKYAPEFAASLGVEGYDEEIFDLQEGLYERGQQDLAEVIADYRHRLTTAEHPKVIQDLNILLESAQNTAQSSRLNREHMLPYFNLPQTLFFGFQGLLDPRVDASRYPAALKRLKKYTGQAPGTQPITELAKARTAERFNVPGLLGPFRDQVVKDMENAQRFLPGIKQMLEASQLDGWQQDFELLSEQLTDYVGWVRDNLMPRTRANHRLPEPIYADNLKNLGVNIDPRELMIRAQFGFAEIKNEMQAIAHRIAEQQNMASGDYRDVMRELKKRQVPNDQVLPLYKKRLADLEDIIRREKIITLPDRDAIIRLATEAEAAGIPAPHLNPPQLIGNTGQAPEFVLVQSNPNSEQGQMDDWSHDGVTWTLTVHEARPGHELQFSSMVENGVSIPRAIFAFNSANVEGWALYAEAVMKEHLPLDGQLFSLQGRLQRAARAFLDPMLNLGMMEPEAAKRFIMEEVGMSEPMATQEVDRYTFRAPGQATSYYYGYMNLQRLRTQVELALRNKFNQQAYHDFVLAQGLLPPELLTKAVMEEFVPTQLQLLH